MKIMFNPNNGFIAIHGDAKPVPCHFMPKCNEGVHSWKITNDFLQLKEDIKRFKDYNQYKLGKDTALWLLQCGRSKNWFDNVLVDVVLGNDEMILTNPENLDKIYISTSKIFFETGSSEAINVAYFGALDITQIQKCMASSDYKYLNKKVFIEQINVLAQLNMLDSLENCDIYEIEDLPEIELHLE